MKGLDLFFGELQFFLFFLDEPALLELPLPGDFPAGDDLLALVELRAMLNSRQKNL